MNVKYYGIDLEQLNEQLQAHKRIIPFKPITPEIIQKDYNSAILVDSTIERFVKVYNKDLVWRKSGFPALNVTRDEELALNATYERAKSWSPADAVIEHEHDTANFIGKIIRANHDALPEVVFETETYLGVEYLEDTHWRSCTKADFISDIIFAKIPTGLFRSIAKSMINLQKNSKVDISKPRALAEERYNIYRDFYHNMPEDALEGFEAKYPKSWYPSLGVTTMSPEDFVVSKTNPSQWKFIELKNLKLGEDINNCFYTDMTYRELVDSNGLRVPLPVNLDIRENADKMVVKYFTTGKWCSFNI